MFGSEEGKRRSVLMWSIKTAGVVAILSYFASNWLAGPGLDGRTLSRLAALTRDAEDPVTTGSVLRGAGSARLDPCSAPRRP